MKNKKLKTKVASFKLSESEFQLLKKVQAGLPGKIELAQVARNNFSEFLRMLVWMSPPVQQFVEKDK